MHIHHSQMTPTPAGVHSAAAEKAAAAQRALETRRKLLKSAFQIEEEMGAGEVLRIGGWPEQESGRGHQRPPSRAASSAARSEDEPEEQPISFWA